MAKENVRDHKYLIIGGSTRAATTSMFLYLSDHPEVCSSNMKETRFFLDADYPLTRKYFFEEGQGKYNKFFCHCPSNYKLRVEATPDYLYSPKTPSKIKDSLLSVKIVFIMREPVSRLISWYRFAKQLGQLPKEMGFDAYIQEQIKPIGKRSTSLQYMLALEHGRYSVYLKPYFDYFKPEDLCVVWFEDIRETPKGTVQKICRFAGIEPTFFEGYNFKVFNQSYSIRNLPVDYIYWNLSDWLRSHINSLTFIRKILKSIRLAIEPLYLKSYTRPPEEVTITPRIQSFLIDYYRQEAAELEKLIGAPPPWKLGYVSDK